MRGNGAPRGRAEVVAARVQALLALESSDAAGLLPDSADRADEPVAGELGAGGVPARHRPEQARPGWSDRLLARVPLRLDPGRRGALAVGVAVLVAALITGAWLASNRPQAVPVSASVPSVPVGPLVGTDGVTESAAVTGSSAIASPASTSAAASQLVIDVAGRVRHPGVYRLPPGSRVDDAVRAAGGVRGRVDLSKLNLAAVLADGQQVPVGVPAAAGGGAPAPGAGGAAPGSSGAAVVDLNTATLEQLETLPGVGPVLGQDILDYRDAHGPFTSIDQLKDVSGIGDVTFGDLKSLVSV